MYNQSDQHSRIFQQNTVYWSLSIITASMDVVCGPCRVPVTRDYKILHDGNSEGDFGYYTEIGRLCDEWNGRQVPRASIHLVCVKPEYRFYVQT